MATEEELAAEWAASLEKTEEESAKVEEEELADAWASALAETEQQAVQEEKEKGLGSHAIEATFKDMNSSHVLDYDGEKPLSLYVWSTGVSKEYRGKEIQDFGGELHGEKLYKHMIGDFAKSIVEVTKQGANINYIYCEGVSEQGQK